jgi:hypothetical protein
MLTKDFDISRNTGTAIFDGCTINTPIPIVKKKIISSIFMKHLSSVGYACHLFVTFGPSCKECTQSLKI